MWSTAEAVALAVDRMAWPADAEPDSPLGPVLEAVTVALWHQPPKLSPF